MPKLADLMEARAAASGKMRGLLDLADKESRDLNDAEHTQLKTLKGEVAGLDKKIELQRDMAEAERAMPAILHSGNRGDGRFETRARDFSVTKAIASAMGEPVDIGFEREISTETSRRAGRTCRGQFMIPDQVFLAEKRVFGDAVLTTTIGADIVPNTHRPDLWIDKLRNSIVVGQLGATVLDNLVGSPIDIPRQTGSATVAWVAEDSALTDSGLTFDDVNLTPKTVGAITSYTRRLMLNAQPSIEQICRNDLAAIIANEIDKRALVGAGGTEPLGVMGNGNSVQISVGGTPTWSAILDFPATIQAANADVSSMAWVMNSATVKKLRSTLKTFADTSSNFITTEPNSLAGYPVAVTNALSSDVEGDSPSTEPNVFFGAWSQLLVGYWSGLDLLVNPYESSAYQKGRVLVRVMRDVDVAVRHKESFVFADDMETT